MYNSIQFHVHVQLLPLPLLSLLITDSHCILFNHYYIVYFHYDDFFKTTNYHLFAKLNHIHVHVSIHVHVLVHVSIHVHVLVHVSSFVINHDIICKC